MSDPRTNPPSGGRDNSKKKKSADRIVPAFPRRRDLGGQWNLLQKRKIFSGGKLLRNRNHCRRKTYIARGSSGGDPEGKGRG